MKQVIESTLESCQEGRALGRDRLNSRTDGKTYQFAEGSIGYEEQSKTFNLKTKQKDWKIQQLTNY